MRVPCCSFLEIVRYPDWNSREFTELEIRYQVRIDHAVFQLHGADPSLHQQPVQAARLPGPEPVSPIFVLIEQVENVVRVVELLGAQPAVAIVPGPDHLTIQSFKLRSEHSLQIMIRISADGRMPRRQADVREVVETGGKAGLREHRDAGHEHEPDVVLGTLDDAVYLPQAVPVCPGLPVILQHVQDRLVVFVNQHHCLMAGRPVQKVQDTLQPLGGGMHRGKSFQVKCLLDFIQLVEHMIFQILRRTDLADQSQCG